MTVSPTATPGARIHGVSLKSSFGPSRLWLGIATARTHAHAHMRTHMRTHSPLAPLTHAWKHMHTLALSCSHAHARMRTHSLSHSASLPRAQSAKTSRDSPVWVSAERCDVGLQPSQRLLLVPKAVVADRVVSRVSQRLVCLRGPGCKHETPVSGWQQQLVSRIGCRTTHQEAVRPEPIVDCDREDLQRIPAL